MKNTWLAIIGAILVLGGACSSDRKPSPETALDRAYHNGILTKDEYEAKKAALLSPATPAPAPPAPAVAAPTPVPPAPAAEVAPSVPAPVKQPAKRTQIAAAPRPVPQPVAPAEPVEEPKPIAPPATRPANPPAAAETPEPPPPPSACEDAELRPGKEKGKQERFFPMPVARVKAAAAAALKDLEFNIHKSSDTEIEASKKRHIGLVGSGGEKMTLHFEEATEGNQRGTRVTGETKKGFVMRAGQKSWTNAVLDQTACTLHVGAGRRADLR